MDRYLLLEYKMFAVEKKIESNSVQWDYLILFFVLNEQFTCNLLSY